MMYSILIEAALSNYTNVARTCDTEGDAPVVVRECVAQLCDVGGNCRDTMENDRIG